MSLSFGLLTILLLLLSNSCAHNNVNETITSKAAKSPVNSSTPSLREDQQSASRESENSLSKSHSQSSPIRAVDFNDFTYPWYPTCCLSQGKVKQVTLLNGELEINKNSKEGIEGIWFSLANVSYADLTRDGVEEAIVTLTANFDPSGSYSCTFIYALERNEPRLVWLHESGNEKNGNLRSIRIENASLVIEEYESPHGSNGGNDKEAVLSCCPKRFIRSYYQWDGTNLKKIRFETLPNEYHDARFLGYPRDRSN